MSSSNGKSFTGMVLVVLALFGVGGALVDKFRHAENDQKIVDPLPVKQAQDTGLQVSAVQKPGFVSANLANDGTGTLAGKALPDTRVVLELNGKAVKTADVSKGGDFFIELELPLAPGKHMLQLNSVASAQGPSVQSDQQIKLDIRKEQDIIVTFLEPGQPPQILQGLEDQPKHDTPPKSVDQAIKKTVSVVPPSPAPKARSGDQPGLATKVAASPAAPSKADQPNILFKETTYITAANETGRIKLSGTARPGAKLRFTIDGKEVGRTIADQSGFWALETNQSLSQGAHMLLAEQLNDKGLRIAHAQVPFDRADAPSKGAPKSAWDRFAGIFTVEPDANGEVAQPSSGKSEKAASDNTGPMKSGKGKASKGKLADASRSAPIPATSAAKTGDTGREKFAFESLSYEVSKAGGLLELSGRGIPGSHIRLFKGIQEIGEVVANNKGNWTFAKRGKMKAGTHIFRAGHVLKSGRIASEARLQYDHVARVREVLTAKSADKNQIPSAKPASGTPPQKMKDRETSYTKPAASGEGADHSIPAGTKQSIVAKSQRRPAVQAVAPRTKIRKTGPRRAHRAKKPRRKMVRRSITRRSAKRRSVGRYYLSRKNKARYLAKRRKYPKSRRTPARVRVRSGTTLWGYSEHYYGRGRHYPLIQRANRRRIKDPNKIYIGQRIKVPRLRKLRRKRR